jgi:hypothetical protein
MKKLIQVLIMTSILPMQAMAECSSQLENKELISAKISNVPWGNHKTWRTVVIRIVKEYQGAEVSGVTLYTSNEQGFLIPLEFGSGSIDEDLYKNESQYVYSYVAMDTDLLKGNYYVTAEYLVKINNQNVIKGVCVLLKPNKSLKDAP